MKQLILALVLAFAVTTSAQFKEELNRPVDIKSGIVNNSPSGFLLGFINPNNFNMKQSVSMSYSAFGGQGVALGVYTNSMSYAFSDKLNIEADVSIVNSPYSTFGRQFSEQLNGIYLSRAQLNYKVSDDFNFMVQFRQLPGGYGYGYSPYGYYSPYRNRSFFGGAFEE